LLFTNQGQKLTPFGPQPKGQGQAKVVMIASIVTLASTAATLWSHAQRVGTVVVTMATVARLESLPFWASCFCF